MVIHRLKIEEVRVLEKAGGFNTGGNYLSPRGDFRFVCLKTGLYLKEYVAKLIGTLFGKI